jgi:hypothetical protein
MNASHETKGGGPQTDALRFRNAYGDGRRGGAVAEEGHEEDLRRVRTSSGSAVSYLSHRLSSVFRRAGTSWPPSEVGVPGAGGACSGEEARRSLGLLVDGARVAGRSG